MSDKTNAYIPPAALTGSMRDFRVPGGADLLRRTEGFFKWQNLRRQNGLWPFSRSTEAGPDTVCSAQDDRGNKMRGVNFASQDYLSLSSHPGDQGGRQGDHRALRRAQRRLAGAGRQYVATRSRSSARSPTSWEWRKSCCIRTGWAAGFGVIKGLVRSADHVVMDMLAHSCLQEGANAATTQHLSVPPPRQLNIAGIS